MIGRWRIKMEIAALDAASQVMRRFFRYSLYSGCCKRRAAAAAKIHRRGDMRVHWKYSLTSSICSLPPLPLYFALIVAVFHASKNDPTNRRIWNFIVAENPLELLPCEFEEGKYFNSSRMWRSWADNMRACMLERVRYYGDSRSQWWNIHRTVTICVGEACRVLLEALPLPNRDDIKFAVLPDKDDKNCTVVTLGIGNDVDSELKLQQYVPTCEFFGADPFLHSGSVYATSSLKGKFYEVAVDAKTGVTGASILEPNGAYQYHNAMKAIGFAEFLLKNVSRTKIDYLFMDNEGPEYRIMEQFAYGGILERNDIVVCQLSVEFHGPLEGYGMTEVSYNRLIETVLARSPMLPVWTAPPTLHVRSYYINSEHPYCVKKFFSFGS